MGPTPEYETSYRLPLVEEDNGRWEVESVARPTLLDKALASGFEFLGPRRSRWIETKHRFPVNPPILKCAGKRKSEHVAGGPQLQIRTLSTAPME